METLQRTANRGSISTGYDIDNSLKLEIDNNEWIYRSSPTAGNRTTFTISLWLKRACLGHTPAGSDEYLAGQGSNARYHFANDTIRFMFESNSTELESTRVLRDPSAWYHIVLAVDTTQGTAADRVKLYINGEQEAWNNTEYPSLNQESDWMNTQNLYIGTRYAGDGDNDLAGYISEVVVLDGTQASPTDLGKYDEDSGIWKPIDVSGLTFGSEGFYYKFDNAGSLGEDSSGNGNDATLNNITAADQATDTPTNNFCTWNPLWAYQYQPTIKEGATVAAYGDSTDENAKATIGLTNGKWYWEAKPSGTIGSQFIGISTDGDSNISSGQGLTQNYQMTIEPQGRYYSYAGSLSESAAGQFTALTTSDTLGIALDMDSATQTIKYYANGSLILTRDLISEMQGRTVFPFLQNYESRTFNINFGGYTINTISSAASDENGYGTFEHAPPTGYYAICTKNLAEYG